MLHRLREHWLEIPLVWPGTREQAETIVHAFASESLTALDREHIVDVLERSARLAWRNLIEAPAAQGSWAAA